RWPTTPATEGTSVRRRLEATARTATSWWCMPLTWKSWTCPRHRPLPTWISSCSPTRLLGQPCTELLSGPSLARAFRWRVHLHHVGTSGNALGEQRALLDGPAALRLLAGLAVNSLASAIFALVGATCSSSAGTDGELCRGEEGERGGAENACSVN